jgi:methionyl aminopeptidase
MESPVKNFMGLVAVAEDAGQEKKLFSGIKQDLRQRKITKTTMTSKSEIMLKAGRILSDTFSLLQAELRPGQKLKNLDDMVAKHLADHSAISVLRLQGFPGYASFSIDTEIIQGIPDGRALKEGDLLSIDLGIQYCGFFVDKARTFPILPTHYEKRYLTTAAEQCFQAGLTRLNTDLAMGFATAWHIGEAIQAQANALGVTPIIELLGHGIGEEPHQEPLIPNFADQTKDTSLKPGMYITIEPVIVYANTYEIVFGDPTIYSDVLSAHWEDTIMINKKGATVIT